MRPRKVTRYEAALITIAARGGLVRCSRSTSASSVCRKPGSGLNRISYTGTADEWCDECVAAAALEGSA